MVRPYCSVTLSAIRVLSSNPADIERNIGRAESLPASAIDNRAGRNNWRIVTDTSGVPPAKSRL